MSYPSMVVFNGFKTEEEAEEYATKLKPGTFGMVHVVNNDGSENLSYFFIDKEDYQNWTKSWN